MAGIVRDHVHAAVREMAEHVHLVESRHQPLIFLVEICRFELNEKMDNFESNLATIYDKENRLYLPIIGENAIPQSRWKAGTGGSAIFDNRHAEFCSNRSRRN